MVVDHNHIVSSCSYFYLLSHSYSPPQTYLRGQTVTGFSWCWPGFPMKKTIYSFISGKYMIICFNHIGQKCALGNVTVICNMRPVQVQNWVASQCCESSIGQRLNRQLIGEHGGLLACFITVTTTAK